VKNFSKFLLISFMLFFCLTAVGWVGYLIKNSNMKEINATAAVSFPVLAPIAEPQAEAKKFNILIIPGHDVKDGGANYKNIYERDLAAEIGAKIADILNEEGDYNITVARDANNWNPILENYFENKKQEIIDWKNKCQQDSNALMVSGKIKYVPDMGMHADVTEDWAVKLYGMNKWANENNVDLVLNLHFNDEARLNMAGPGDLKGFNIFIPESQMKNSATSKIIAQNIFNELKKIEPTQNNLLEDQSLIALGASGTLNSPSMLIEYAYIYEKGINTDKMAQQTVLGVENYVKTLKNNSTAD
jgi:N-acetylmuramoyl-L-alanine amidase